MPTIYNLEDSHLKPHPKIGIQNEMNRTTHKILFLALACLFAVRANASIALLEEEPYGTFGAVNPTGHAAIYLNHICADTPTSLRPCHDGEYGVVISRYHKIDGYDWIAMPLVAYLYAVDDVSQIPTSISREGEADIRNSYRRAHLEALAPDAKDGKPPKGEWVQLVGSSYDRTIHGFQIDTTPQQDQRFIAIFNDRKNVGHFNLLFHNCADFSKLVLNTYQPHAVHRNFIADVGITTPKQDARSWVSYGHKHPELNPSAFIIPQVKGSIGRSHADDGVAESLIKSKKYVIPLAILAPEVTGGVVVAYLADGRMKKQKDTTIFNIGDEESLNQPTPIDDTQRRPLTEPTAPTPSPAPQSPALPDPASTPTPAPAPSTPPALTRAIQ
jgi:hypothetical protein